MTEQEMMILVPQKLKEIEELKMHTCPAQRSAAHIAEGVVGL